ncbi:MAG: HU family DNA-binding protein [Candidatus Puniceispirillales bacterium]
MNKSNLIAKIVDSNQDFYQKDIAKIVDIFFGTLTKAIVKNDRAELRGFGTFDVKNREARIARNPKNGSIVAVPSKKIPFFRMGKGMKERINK